MSHRPVKKQIPNGMDGGWQYGCTALCYVFYFFLASTLLSHSLHFQPVSLCHICKRLKRTQDTLFQSLCQTLLLIWQDHEACHLSVCLSAKRLEVLFLGRVCVRSIHRSVPVDPLQHEGMRPNTLGLDLQFNVHSQTIFILIHVREYSVSRTWMSFFF